MVALCEPHIHILGGGILFAGIRLNYRPQLTMHAVVPARARVVSQIILFACDLAMKL